jgi:hypothetical protein
MTEWEEKIRRTVISDTLFIGTFSEQRDAILRVVQDEINKAFKEIEIGYSKDITKLKYYIEKAKEKRGIK